MAVWEWHRDGVNGGGGISVCVGGVCVCVGNQSEVHERWDMNSHNSITKEVQLLLKACLSSVVNMVEPTLKTSIVY